MMKPGMSGFDRFKSYLTFTLNRPEERYLSPRILSRASGHAGRGYGESGAVAQAPPLPFGSGAELLPVAVGEFDHHVLHRQNPLGKSGYKSEDVVVPKDRQRRLHKALLRYHDPANWPADSRALEAMGKSIDWRSP